MLLLPLPCSAGATTVQSLTEGLGEEAEGRLLPSAVGFVGPFGPSASGVGVGRPALVSSRVPGDWPGPPREGQCPQGALRAFPAS